MYATPGHKTVVLHVGSMGGEPLKEPILVNRHTVKKKTETRLNRKNKRKGFEEHGSSELRPKNRI